MKPIVLSFLVVSLAALAVARQSGFTFGNTEKGVFLSAREGRAERAGDTGMRLILVGNVAARDTKEKLEIRAGKITATTVKVGAVSELKRAIAEGKVRLLKTVQASGGTQVTQIDGSRADYQVEAAQGVVDMAGPVTIRNSDSQKRETLVATGNRGKAFLVKGARTSRPSGLSRAELTGKVRAVVVQSGAEKGNMVATAGRMVLEEGSTTRTITLTENVDVNGTGSAQEFSAQNMQRVVMVLDKKGEVVQWNAK